MSDTCSLFPPFGHPWPSCLLPSHHPMDCSTPGFPVLHYLLELAQTHVHWVDDVIQPFYPLVIPFSSCPQSFPASGSFPMSWLFSSGGQSSGASASVLSMNIQGWFPLGLTGLIFLLSKGLSRVFSNTTVRRHQFFWCSALFMVQLRALPRYFYPSVVRGHAVLSMNIQSWFPLGLIVLIFLLSKGLSSVFASTTVWKDQFFSAQPFLWSSSHICT